MVTYGNIWYTNSFDTVNHVIPGEGTICNHTWPYRRVAPATAAQVKGPYATLCDHTGGRVGGTVCDHMWPVVSCSVFFCDIIGVVTRQFYAGKCKCLR